MKAAIPFALALVLAGCVTAPPPARALGGDWGGRSIALSLDGRGGRVTYDCASGTIDEPVRPDSAGRFVARGTHTPGHGGPDRIDRPPVSYPARYRGIVSGGAMQLNVDVPAQGLHLGPFALRRGAQPMLFRCL